MHDKFLLNVWTKVWNLCRCLLLQCCFGHSVCHCWGSISIFGAALSMNKRDRFKMSFWALNNCFYSSFFTMRRLKSWALFPLSFAPVGCTFFSFYCKNLGSAQNNAHSCEWKSENQHNARSVRLNTDRNVNCFYCRKLYQCAEELWCHLTGTHCSIKCSFVQQN